MLRILLFLELVGKCNAVNVHYVDVRCQSTGALLWTSKCGIFGI